MTADRGTRGGRTAKRGAGAGKQIAWAGAFIAMGIAVALYVSSKNTVPEAAESNVESKAALQEPAETDAPRALQTPAAVDAAADIDPVAPAAEAPKAPPARGADVPFVTLEAEAPANSTNGRVVRLTGLPSGTDHSPELEASGRAYVELTQQGAYVEFPNAPAANALVIRHCIPDSPEGGGITATLGLYVDGVRRQDVTLTSTHNWLYGNGKTADNGQNNAPNEHPHVFWDETRLFVEGGIRRGDTIRLQKDEQDTAAYYRIDLIDAEFVAPPLKQPVDSLSIAEYGAKGGDARADTAALRACIDAARAQKKTVWIPPGTYLQNERFSLEGVKVQGAGMWHTILRAAPSDKPRTFGMHLGFSPSGTGAGVSDLSIAGTDTDRGGMQMAFIGTGSGWTIHNVWMTHLNVGLWMAGEDAVVSGCRVRMTYADGININNGHVFFARRIVVEHNHLRGTGDDGIAILSHNHSPHKTQQVTVRRNTVVAPWWAHNFDLAGGNGHVIEDNLFADSTQCGGLVINLPGAYPMTPQAEAVIRRNDVIRCGGNFAWQRRGAIWIYSGSTTIDGVLFENNRIIDPLFRAIHMTGDNPQNVTFKNNTIENPGEDGIAIDGSVSGSGTFIGNTLSGLPAGKRALVNDAKEKYRVEQSDNSWQVGDDRDDRE